GSLTYATLSTCMIVCVVFLFCAHFLLKGSLAHLPQYAAGMLMLLFVCAGMMHERYLFPVVVLLFLGYLTTKDKRLIYLMAAVSVASFLNIASVLERNIRIGGVEAHLSAPMCGIKSDLSALEYLSASLTTLLSIITVYVCLSPTAEKAATEQDASLAQKQKGYPLPDVQVSPPARLTKRDFSIMLVCTLLYAALAFTNLGSTKAPQTAWVSDPGNGEESILLDLGEEREFSVLYFPGILYYDSTLTVETGNDLSYWDMRTANINYANCFSWYYVTGTNYSPLSGRYVRLSTKAYDMPIYEVLLRDAKTGEVIPYEIVGTYENETVFFLNDEQDTLDGEPGYFNSTYFDEIYHARTGFEHLHGLPTYETTHPPLGKVFISWCIGIFGMTPFGWRFAGTMAGVLMLPAMYLLGKLLSRNKWGGLFAMLMITFDLMHFTQTRIATIDSFVVLFILWAVYFMLYWFKMDYFHTPFLKTLVPLGLSGLFMGLSIASKWTGCYNAVGLALIFFWGLFRRYRIWKQAKDTVEDYQAALLKTSKKKQ
ncbi:MAG: phospholipid carrier-dependent glycosyltransferase, partial [Clostridia bacterium]|nr:phospholipid carrier-dependent glycosyltransferase [Clostridia bacterium]